MTQRNYNREEIIWKYIDGKCAGNEKKWVETELKSNSSFREMYDSCLETHKHLKAMEYESPSVRFVQNVVEAIPLAIPRKQYKLIPGPVWKWGLTGAILICIFGVAGTSGVFSINSPTPLADGYIRDLIELQRLPAMQYVYWISIAACSLLILDYFHLRRASLR